MTEKRTLALSTRQWRVLLHDNLDVLKATVANTESLTPESLKTFCAQLDDMKMLAGAWYQAGAPAYRPSEQPVRDIGAEIGMPPIRQTNGATAPKKKRGRPSNAELAAREMQ